MRSNNERIIATIPDEDFIRGKVPMTKSTIRDLSIIKLGLRPGDVLFDIGSGTGSIAIQAASMNKTIKVYAIEKNKDALELIEANRKKFECENVEIIHGVAPEAIKGLETPDCGFIGGSGGNLREIIDTLGTLNPNVRIVINAISLETLGETVSLIESYDRAKNQKGEGKTASGPTFGIEDLEIEQISVSKSKEVGSYHMMMGENPIYIISFNLQPLGK